MLGIENYGGFILACILLNITPGADTVYILARSISQGRRAGVFSVFGIITGSMMHTLGVALGLSLLLTSSSWMFAAVKFAGAAYLAFLGVELLRSKVQIFEQLPTDQERSSMKKIYYQGFLTNLLNPKVALFFLSFLPQFVNPLHGSASISFLVLGLTFMTTGTIWCVTLAYSASKVSSSLRRNDKIAFYLQKATGLLFILMAVKLVWR